jgi:hypothetical protein
MDKPREIPGVAVPKNHATVAQVAEVVARAAAIGLDWVDLCKRAGIERATAFRLKAGRASIGSLRSVEEFLVKLEAKAPKQLVGSSAAAPITEWAELGARLRELDPNRFGEMLNGLRLLVDAKEQEKNAFSMFLRPNPDRPR